MGENAAYLFERRGESVQNIVVTPGGIKVGLSDHL
jgi:hypothetical protein